jgi:hypothetical protein
LKFDVRRLRLAASAPEPPASGPRRAAPDKPGRARLALEHEASGLRFLLGVVRIAYLGTDFAERPNANAVVTEYSDDGMESRAEQYRRKAAECVQIAARALEPRIKQQYEDLARQWLELAQQIDNPRRP